jgi:hypothetical protein
MSAPGTKSPAQPLGSSTVNAAAQPGLSGRYEGEMSSPTIGLDVLDLRIDVDTRYAHSPVMKRVSGDFYQLNKIKVPGSPPKVSRVYRESWIVNQPKTKKLADTVEITGVVKYWKGIHPPTKLKIVLASSGAAASCLVSFTRSGGQSVVYNCAKKSDSFRSLNLEIDVCQSVDMTPLLPSFNTGDHAIKPAGMAARVLTIEEAYREAGVSVTIRPQHSVIDDSDPEFGTWSDAELHNAMEKYFSQVSGPWPKWEMWGVLASAYDEPSVGGVMFDAAAAFGGAGKAPERQGFAVFRKHEWFDQLPAAAPATQDEAAAVRKFLYTWVHEAGHAFNFLHSWDKNRPDALSWMNYDWRYDSSNGPDSFWSHFAFTFDDEELIHLRHGDRSAVIMGGDPWASGGHLEAPPGAEYLAAPPGAMSSVDSEQPVELLIRSKEYFEFMEPVSIELRVRNLFPNVPLTLDTHLNPEYGGVIVYIRRPDGRIVEYSPVMCKLAFPSSKQLVPLQANQEPGPDRYSEEVLLSYGRYGFYFDAPGEYYVRALYQGGGDLLIPSNVHRLRVGSPLTRELDKTAQDYFSYEVGMNLYLEGSRSPYLEKGLDLLRDMSERHSESLLGAKLAMTVANSFTYPFYDLEARSGVPGETLKLTKAHDADPEAALEVTTSAVDVFQKSQQKALNLSYHQLVSQRVDCLVALDQNDVAIDELYQLHQHLSNNGANAPVLEQISNLAGRISSTAGTVKPHNLWERVRAHDRSASLDASEEELNEQTSESEPFSFERWADGSAGKATKSKRAKKSTKSRKSSKKRSNS